MFDTVNIRCRRPFKAAVLDLLKERGDVYRGDVDAPFNWFLRVSPDLDRHGYQRASLFGEGPAGIVVRGHDNVVEWVQASLPRVLYGDNGALLRSPEDVVDAENALNSILDQVSVPEIAVIEYNRIDLVLHFRAAVQRYLAAHRHVRHPLIRNETVEYDGSGIRLPGRKVTIRMYDKLLQMGAGPGDVLRLEIELRKPKLGELFGLADGQAMRNLDFWKAYEVYRSIVCQMRPQGLPENLDLNRLLAECEAVDFRLSNGLTAMETYRGCVDRKTYLDRRRAVKGMVLTAANIDWQKLLPVGRLPDDLPDADPQKVGHQFHGSVSRGDANRSSRLAEEGKQVCGRTQSEEGATEAEHAAAHPSITATSSLSSTSVTSSSATTPISLSPIFQQQTQNNMNTPTTDPEDNTLEPQPAPIPTAPPEPSTELGLDPVVAATPAATTSDRPAGIVNVIYLAASALKPNPKNIAIYGDEEADDELVESVRVHNILTPLHATVDGVIVSGHRRLKAALKLGLEAVPVFLTEVNADPLLAEEQFLESNRNRPKNNEQLVREFMAYKRIETERARVRMLQGTPVLKSTQGGDDQPAGKARDIAARKVGMGATKAEHGEAVVLVIDRFASENGPCAEMLRGTLNMGSIERAYNEAIVRGCIPNPAKERTRRATTKRKQAHAASTGVTHNGADESGGERPGGGDGEIASK